MKKTTLYLFVGVFMMNWACKNENTTQIEEEKTEVVVNEGEKNENEFDLTSIPVSNHELGKFPYFSLPENLKNQNNPLEKEFETLYIPIDGKFQPIDGKVWKSNIVADNTSGSTWSLSLFYKNYDAILTEVGGVKIFDGKLDAEQLKYLSDNATYLGEDGSIDYWNEPVKVYVIRRENGDDIFVQISGNSASGKIQILQKEAFKSTISLLNADEIEKALTEQGKVTLHINFDTDKASLKKDGIIAVNEIMAALKNEPNLNIEINGYTDNTGTAEHNLNLSKQRAETVKNELIKNGIAENRLKSNGFGQENPIADNTTDSGKAQNRRVELVKF